VYQLDLKPPTLADRHDSTAQVDVPRVLSRGALYLVLAGTGWLVVWATLQLLFKLLGGPVH
jgi:hypothetical protein